jgi:two-component system, chemotaxis family, CheB/CheR fusion protein
MANTPAGRSGLRRVADLEKELAAAREELRALRERHAADGAEIEAVRGERSAAEETRARLASIVESSDDAIVSKTLDGIITTWNRAAEQMFGHTAAEAVGRHITLIIPKERRAEEDEVLARLRRGEKVDHFETVRQAKDGRRLVISLTVSPIRDAAGRVIGASKVARDITERKRAEESLRLSEARFRALAEASPALIFRLDPQGRVTYVNPRFQDYFGDKVSPHGDAWKGLLHPDDAAAYLSAVEAAQRDRARLEAVARLGDGRGSWRWIESHALPIFGRDDVYQGHVGISLDVTDRKQAEEAMQESDRHKNEFLAMLAHELRNPLAPIRSSLEVMRRVAGGPSSLDAAAAAGATGLDSRRALASALETTERQVGHMVRLVDDLLDLARISRGKITLRWGRVDLASVVHQALEAVRSLCDSMSHELTVALPPQPVCLNGDSARLAQIVSNLLGNACKFTPRGGKIWLTVTEEPSAGSPPGVVISVRDTGIGMSPDQLPRMFEAFAQADSSLERSGSGLGIGLTLVRTLVQMHGGTVEARSAGMGHGSEFLVHLPTAAGAPAPGPAATVAPPATSSPPPRRILVVDDNRDSAESLAMLLELHGHQAFRAHDGLEALEATTRLQPEVILLDIGLPTLNGYETARRIRELSGESRPMLVALTGWGQEEDRRRSEEAGFDAHMVKPVDYRALEELLAGKGAG